MGIQLILMVYSPSFSLPVFLYFFPPGWLSNRDGGSQSPSLCSCRWQQGATRIGPATTNARRSEQWPCSQVHSIWQIIAHNARANQQLAAHSGDRRPVYGLGRVGIRRWGAGECWGAKWFDNYQPLFDHHADRHTHTNWRQGQTRSPIPNPSTESLLQLSLHLGG